MMPLWTSAMSPDWSRCGWALTSVGGPWVAQRVCRVDIRVDRTFTVGGQPLNVFAGVQNVTNRRNFASYTWNRRTNTQQFGEQQGLFPIIGLDWRF